MLLHLVTDRVQRAEGFLFHVLEVTAARVVAAIQVLVVVLFKSSADSYVKRPRGSMTVKMSLYVNLTAFSTWALSLGLRARVG